MVVKTKKETPPAEASGQLAFETVVKLDIQHILPNPYQPEGRLNPPQDVVERIAASIKEHGLLQTPVVRCRADGKYEMGDGWIRLKGYNYLSTHCHVKDIANWQLLPVIIRNLTDKQMADLVMEANTVRHDLSPIELARFYKKYLEDFAITQAELARIHSVSQGEIANTLRLLDLPEDIQKKVISQEISETHARYLLQVKDPKEMTRLAKSVVENGTTVASLDREIKNKLWQGTRPLSKGNRFEGYELKFDPECCNGCEHKLSLKYPWGGSKDELQPRCVDIDCWGTKQKIANEEAHKKEIDDLKAQGITNFPAKSDGTMDTWKFREFGKTGECKVCPKRAAIPDYSGKYQIVCGDKKYFDAKCNAKEKADKHAQEAEAEKTAKYIEDVFTGLPINEKSLQTTIECLLNSTTEAETVLKFVKAFNLFEIRKDEDLEDQDELISGAMTAIKEKNLDIVTLNRIIARLSFDIFVNEGSYGNPEKETIDHLLKSFKAAHQGKAAPAAAAQVVEIPKHTLEKIGSDYVAVNEEGVIIATGSTKEVAEHNAKYTYLPVETVLDPQPADYILNHTYRISFKDHTFNDVTAETILLAIAATGKKTTDVTEVKVHKCSGKPSTGGGVGTGWGKCTEVIGSETE